MIVERDVLIRALLEVIVQLRWELDFAAGSGWRGLAELVVAAE